MYLRWSYMIKYRFEYSHISTIIQIFEYQLHYLSIQMNIHNIISEKMVQTTGSCLKATADHSQLTVLVAETMDGAVGGVVMRFRHVPVSSAAAADRLDYAVRCTLRLQRTAPRTAAAMMPHSASPSAQKLAQLSKQHLMSIDRIFLKLSTIITGSI